MKTVKFPLIVTESGVSAKIRKVTKPKNGHDYTAFVVEYVLLGRRKQVWRSDLEAAKTVAREACIKIANGHQLTLELCNSDRLAYLRATEAVSEIKSTVDGACSEYAAAVKLLAGRASLSEVCRDWIKRHAVELPAISVPDAVEKLMAQAVADRKSPARLHQLRVLLDRFTAAFQCQVHTLTPRLVSEFLAALPLSERSKRNQRDVLAYFFRWLVLHGYLAKGTDLLDGVQNYSARKFGAVEIFSPGELKALLAHADRRLIPFVAIAAFAGLRHSEIKRLDWRQIELSEKPGESFIEVRSIENTKSDQRRRLVPVKENLRAWLQPFAKMSGPVCPFKKTVSILPQLAAKSNVAWKKNALRHSCISYRIAECADIPRVSDESGNSVQIIKTNYLRRVKPAEAKEWFDITPDTLAAPSLKIAA